jgi:hypothetical protein
MPDRKKKASNLHKEIDEKVDDVFQRHARVQEETSSDGRFSTYEIAEKTDPRAGDLILQYRGAPKEDA